MMVSLAVESALPPMQTLSTSGRALEISECVQICAPACSSYQF